MSIECSIWMCGWRSSACSRVLMSTSSAERLRGRNFWVYCALSKAPYCTEFPRNVLICALGGDVELKEPLWALAWLKVPMWALVNAGWDDGLNVPWCAMAGKIVPNWALVLVFEGVLWIYVLEWSPDGFKNVLKNVLLLISVSEYRRMVFQGIGGLHVGKLMHMYGWFWCWFLWMKLVEGALCDEMLMIGVELCVVLVCWVRVRVRS
jgi:hypothetical protein